MSTPTDWLDVNRRALEGALRAIRTNLQNHIDRADGKDRAHPSEDTIPTESAVGLLQQIFGLTPFETSVLVLAAGVELDSGLAVLCAAALGDPARTEPTFSLALAALPDAHWSALAPDGPLRRWHLVEPVPSTGGLLTRAALRVDERILHFLVGLDTPDAALLGRVRRLTAPADMLPARHETCARTVADLWAGPTAAVQLIGDEETATDIAARAAAMLGGSARHLAAAVVPADPVERTDLLTYLNRDGQLGAGPLVVVCSEAAERAELGWLRDIDGPHAVIAPAAVRSTPGVAVQVPNLDTEEQAGVWRAALNPDYADDVDALADQFNITAATIRAAAAQTNATAGSPWAAACARTRNGLDALATRIDAVATWDDLVLPGTGEQQLREIAAMVRQRRTVFRTWGMNGGGARGTGVSALFAGPSGVGKTLAAEVLAAELGLDLYRIDLSQIVSKYIGETEKNLRLVFDAADAGGCVLLFDEADALFGKRTEVKDSHDRYANLEVSYLLQRMEAYRGLAILTSNLKDNIDKAFLRRLTAIVTFPFPDLEERARIWRRMLVPTLPVDDVSVESLAQLAVPGGVIRNIALGAAFRAAEAGTPVQMRHLLDSAHRECAKLGRPVSTAEVGDWL